MKDNKAATAPDKIKELPSQEVELTDDVLKNIAGGTGSIGEGGVGGKVEKHKHKHAGDPIRYG
jgi:hypothetical protein